jgi:hypothetical protein
MNLDYVRNEIARIRRQHTRLRCSDALALARHRQNCHLRGCEQRWMILVTDERSCELSLRGKARDKLSTVQFPTHRQCN